MCHVDMHELRHIFADTKDEGILELFSAWERFSCAMWEKLLQKYKEGFRGWDEIDEKKLALMAHDHACKQFTNKGEEVDVANFMMFLWYRAAGKEG